MAPHLANRLVLVKGFDEADVLFRFVQSRTGKLDESIVITYWLGKEHMIRDKAALACYVKFECN